jgi:FlaA1/EpsC-like NDP-sugar epimerase
MTRGNKTLFVIIFDYILLVLSFLISLSIRNNEIFIPSLQSTALIVAGPFIAIPIFYLFGLYKSLIRYSNYQSILTIMAAVTCYTLIWFAAVFSVNLIVKPYDFLIINWLISVFSVGGIRYIARWLLSAKAKKHLNALIYGAGDSGAQLLSAMKYNPEMTIVSFIDDDKKIQGKYIEGIKVRDKRSIEKLNDRYGIDEILLAIPSISVLEKQRLLNSLKEYSITIRSLPKISDLTQGRVTVADLKKIKIEDLLKRDARRPIDAFLRKDISGKTIMVTGAGGSIGSELCRQIITLQPNMIVLYEISELGLYTIERDLKDMEIDIPIKTVLGSVNNQSRLTKIIKKYHVNTVYHAAAYKHVPLVEKNKTAGIYCNVFGTESCINASIDGGVDCFVFISTDKAVNPSSAMGATKRCAELILQAIANKVSHDDRSNSIRMSIVRFGNVLGSSGSVVPLFRDQIEKGGPVTVTHKKMIRYFMTIKEAAELVIQAGSMGSSGDIFVLDMGEQLNVLDLAKDMIRLSGLTVRDTNNPDGDIEIIFTGKRKGEKLKEELLTDGSSETDHKKIMRANNSKIDFYSLERKFHKLSDALKRDDDGDISEILKRIVPEYRTEE